MSGATKPDRSKLENPLTRRALIIELATSGLSQAELSRRHNVSECALSKFKNRHLAEIEAVRRDQDKEYAGLLIVEKANRLDVYEQLLQTAMTPTPKVAGKDGDAVRDPITQEYVYEIDAGTATRVLKQVAEELGHLPNRVTLAGGLDIKTEHTVNGVDVEKLK